MVCFNIIFIHYIHSYFGVPDTYEWLVDWLERQWFMGSDCAVHCVFPILGSCWCTTESYHTVLILHPPPLSSYISPCGNLLPWQPRGHSWPYDELTLALTGEAFLLIHTGTLTCRNTLFDRDAQIQTCSDMYTYMWEHKRTHSIHPLCPAMSQHSPGGHLLVVPCPQAIRLHDWLISSRAVCSLVVGGCSLSLWKHFAFKFHFVPCTPFSLEMCSSFYINLSCAH